MDLQGLFTELYAAKNETDIDAVLGRHSELTIPENWRPLGGNDNNFGVVENQQSNPVAALVEKLTNSIDALLMRRCYEAGMDPKSPLAPRSGEDAVKAFFPDYKNWDLSRTRSKEAENVQIIADSYPRDTSDTSLIIYDNGEGQHPENFESTFLSLLHGNKNEIHFVQGRYNMGGSGAIAFCGKKRYQLIASKRYDGTGKFGFTLIRKHPLTQEEEYTKKSTWYEYLHIGGHTPAFEINELDLGLHNRPFKTGTVIKLYSYELKGNKNIRRDLGRSLNEFLFEPTLPILVVEKSDRYPNDRALQEVVFGLGRELTNDNSYIETTFSETFKDKIIGDMKVNVYVFKARAKDKDVASTRKTIQNEYFKNGMSVLFSLDGQVHAHLTSEFISRTLKYNLLRDYVIIYVDCSHMKTDFRDELFMASRDRLKQGEESSILRKILGDNLRRGQLEEIYKHRKDSISVENAEDNGALLRSFAENLPISDDLRHLLSRTFKLDQSEKAQPKQDNPIHAKHKREKGPNPPFQPKRFPSFFKLDAKQQGGRKLVEIPLNGSKTLAFDSDVENQYFDRTEDPGELRIAIMKYTPNNSKGGTKKGTVNDISDIFSVSRKSPNNGTIKVILNPTKDVSVGDEIEIEADLTSAGQEFREIFWVKISEPLPDQPGKKTEPEPDKIGLPGCVLTYKEVPVDQPGLSSQNMSIKTWEDLGNSSIEMDWGIVMYPSLEGDILDTIYINMDCNVLKDYKSKIRNLSVEQAQLSDRKYITSVYFHTLFLYIINKNKGYSIKKNGEDDEKDVDLSLYLQDLFSSYYAAFIMNFDTKDLIDSLG